MLALYATHLAILLREAAPHAGRAVHRRGAAGDARRRRTTCGMRGARLAAASGCATGWDALVDALSRVGCR